MTEKVGPGRRVQAALRRSHAAAEEGQYQKVLAMLLPYQGAARKIRDPGLRASFAYRLGAAYYALGHYEEAVVQLRLALECAGASNEGDCPVRGRVLVVQGHIDYIRGNLSAATTAYERAVECFGKVRDFDAQGSVYAGLSLVHRRKGDPKAALRYAELSVRAYEASNRKWDLARQVTDLAVVREENGHVTAARDAGQRALELASELENAELEASAHAVLASIALSRNDHRQAVEHAEASLRLASQPDLSPTRGTSLRVLAMVAELRGEPALTDKYFTEALEALKSTGQTAMFLSVSGSYIGVLKDRGASETALGIALHAAESRLAASGNRHIRLDRAAV